MPKSCEGTKIVYLFALIFNKEPLDPLCSLWGQPTVIPSSYPLRGGPHARRNSFLTTIANVDRLIGYRRFLMPKSKRRRMGEGCSAAEPTARTSASMRYGDVFVGLCLLWGGALAKGPLRSGLTQESQYKARV